MKVLVTGATGLIGNRLVHKLCKRGDDVTALVRDAARARKILPEQAHLAVGDITRPATLPRAVEGAQWVFHAAGMPEQWQKDPGIFDEVNCRGTVNVLEAAMKAGVERAVYTSTMDVFAAEPGGTLVETNLDPDDKPTAYERSKQAADRAVRRLVERGLDVVMLCPAAVYGPSPVHVGLNSFFIKLLNKQSPVLPPGGMSVVYVDGCVDAHIAAAEKGRSGEHYLLSDEYASNHDLAAEVKAQSELKRVPKTVPLWLLRGVASGSELAARAFGLSPLVAHSQLTFLQWRARVDASKAMRELDFEPTSLSDGVARTIAFLRDEGLVP